MNKHFKKSSLFFIFFAVCAVLGFAVYFSFFAPKSANATGWFSSGGTWTYRIPITLKHQCVGGGDCASVAGTEDEPNFPVLISLTGLSNIQANGTDIRFTSSDGTTQLPREIETYSGGTLVAWVNVTSLSHTADTVIYMYYGNASATVEPDPASTYGSQNTWKEGASQNFAGVWHMPNGSTLGNGTYTYDSTSNANTGTLSGTTKPSATPGQIDGGASFDGSSSYIIVNKAVCSDFPCTITAWFKDSGLGNDRALADIRQDSGSAFCFNLFSEGNKTVEARSYGNAADNYGASGAYTGSGWNFAVAVLISPTSKQAYMNGIPGILQTINSGAVSNLGHTTIGATIAFGSKGNFFNGYIDEVQISNTARSAGWIKTEFNNQNVPASFYTSVGGQETNNTAPSFGAGASQPSDTSSSLTTPTNAGANVAFTATATDGESNNYYLAICKTDAITAGAGGAAPTCATSQTWCVSGSTTSGNPASCNYKTSASNSESNAWFAFVCDNNASSACSASSQGILPLDDTGSPFVVNRAPAFSTATVSTNPIAVNATQTFNTTSSDADTSPTVTLYACKSNDFTGSACGSAGEWCHTTSPGATNASCTYTIQSSDGYGTKNFFSYIVDNHSFASASNPIFGTFVISGTGSASTLKFSGNLKFGGNIKFK